MLTIRPEQLDAFQPAAERAFVRRLAEHLRREHPEFVGRLPEDVLAEMAANGVARARRHGFDAESDITAFVALMFTVAPNFDEHPLIRHVLADQTAPPPARLERLETAVPRGSWEEAARRYDETAWFPPEPEAVSPSEPEAVE